MKKNLLIAAIAVMLIPTASFAQQPRPQAPQPEYKFTVVKENPITSVKNQNSSGTCWCFSTISFLESEVIRIKGIKDAAQYPDLSEMFVVGQSYKDRAEKYVRLNGNLTFGAGSEADDVLDVKVSNGMIMLVKPFRHRTLEERAAEYGGQLHLDGEFDWGEPVGREIWE